MEPLGILRPVDLSRAMPPCFMPGDGIGGELARIARTRTCREGETILAEMEESTFVGTVIAGILRMQKTLNDGRQQIVGLLLPSDMFGRIFAQRSHVSIEAATDATLCCYPRSGFEAIMRRHPELAERLMLAVLKDLWSAQDWMLLLATQTVTERVATFLLMLLRRRPAPFSRGKAGGRTTIAVPISRRDMAAYLGTTAESISRSVQEMARQGAIEIIDPRHFRLLDLGRLIGLSGRDGSDLDLEPRRARFG
jgi:CRP/FNR family transcriptional regulator